MTNESDLKVAEEWVDSNMTTLSSFYGEGLRQRYIKAFLAGRASAPKIEWIKCSERMPTEEKRGISPNSILAYGISPKSYNQWIEKNGEPYPWMELPERFVACFVPEHGFLVEGWYFRDTEMRKLVTHWQPLPEPPSEISPPKSEV
jgi:hypothetical protein